MAWQGFFTLLAYSLVMGIASFLAGSLPLSFSLSQNHSRIISAIGTGLLVGTCLIIIIPEGIETLYSSAASLPSPPPLSPPPSLDVPTTPIAGAPLPDTPADPNRLLHLLHRRQTDSSPHEAPEPHAWIGLALITGFITMYLIDQLPRLASRLTSSPRKPLHISLANLSQGPHRAGSRLSLDAESSLSTDDFDDPLTVGTGGAAQQKSSATTIGLVIHAAADGIALAASSFVSQARVGVVVFLALMIHKAPAAFGLTSVLLKQGRGKRGARAHLIVFSCAAPVAALGTWVLMNVFGGAEGVAGGDRGGSMEWATGLLLLFSGGTFLYVAMHTMQEATVEAQEEGSNGYGNGHAYRSVGKARGDARPLQPDVQDTLFVISGMLLPLLTQIGHAH